MQLLSNIKLHLFKKVIDILICKIKELKKNQVHLFKGINNYCNTIEYNYVM